METVRIGLLGYGFGGKYFHAPLIASAAGCELAGVVTRSPQRRAEVVPRDQYPGYFKAGFSANLELAFPFKSGTSLNRQVESIGAIDNRSFVYVPDK